MTGVSRDFVDSQAPHIHALFSSLDLDRPGFKSVREAWRSRDVRCALARLVAYFEAKPLDERLLWAPPLSGAEHRRVANGVLEGVFELQGLSAFVPQRSGGGLDWTDTGPRGDAEWTRFLNRHDFFRSLLRAWQQTGDERYRAAIGTHLSDWVENVPRPVLPTRKGTWRSLEVARRATLPWLEAFFCRSPGPALDPEARMLMLSSLVDHGRVLRHWHARGGNHLFTELVALAVLAVAWPEFKRAPEWLEYAVKRACRVLLDQTYPDGAHVELSNHYHRVVLQEAERLAAVLSLTGRETLFESVRERLASMWDYFAGVSRPDGYGPLNNDSDLDPNHWYLLDASNRHDRSEWRYIATGGAEGLPPAGPPSRFFSWAGQAVMRSGWDQEAHWARFDMGPHGTSHQHNDQLSIELFAGGRPFLVDSGRYTYRPGRERDYFRGPRGHNVIRVEERGSVRPPNKVGVPLEATAILEPEFDFFRGRARFRGNLFAGRGTSLWKRAMFYLRGRYWIVVDHLQAAGPSEITASWLFHPDCSLKAEADCVHTLDTGKSNLAVLATASVPTRLEVSKGQREPCMRGWYSEAYNRIQACSQVEYHASVARSVVFGWVLYPLQQGVTPERARFPAAVLSRDELTVRITVSLPDEGGEDLAVIELGDKEDIQVTAGVSAMGPCALLHRGPEGQRLIGRPLNATELNNR